MNTTIEYLLRDIPSDGLIFRTFAVRTNELLRRLRQRMPGRRGPEPIPGPIIRFLEFEGIIPPPILQGRTPRYGREHLVRVVVARVLQHEGHAWSDIRAVLPRQTTTALEQALRRLDPPPPQVSPSVPLASFGIAPGVIVLIDPAAVSDPHRLADALARVARSFLPPHSKGEL